MGSTARGARDAGQEARAGTVTDAKRNPLVGSWELRSWEAVGDDGSVSHPMGEHPQGLLAYTAEGLMITTIAPRDRPALGSPDPLTGGDPEERLGAAETFIAYSSRYTYDGHDVTHAVEMSLFPNWVGTRQVRHVEISADRNTLTLTADPFVLRGRRSTHRLVWVRLTDGPPESR